MNKQKNLFIVGAGTTANSALQIVREYDLFNVAGFVVDAKYKTSDVLWDYPLYEMEGIEQHVNKSEDLLFVAIAWNNLNADRKAVYERLKAKGYSFANLISPLARVIGKIQGDNCWLSDYATIHNNAVIGTNNYLCCHAYIAHDCEVGSHNYFAPRACMAGTSKVGDSCFLGINSVVYDCVTIGNKCIIGGNATVQRSLPDFSVCKIASDSMTVRQYDERSVEWLMTPGIKSFGEQ